ncbi:MAG: hypothetical protein GTN93_02720, partial [Anaerolineae bacterium]|nr:hypothetical protein [Anaerolineae bacterium]NIQ77016.1 hypothetical protein [Anaerolineae bacterium]
DEDQYEMQVYPTSLLPTTPAGKLATVTEMLDKGLIPKEHALKLLSFPDVEAVVTLETAA